MSSQPTEVDKGNQILGQLFGSKDGSRAVAAQAAALSGVRTFIAQKDAADLAMVAAGYVMKQAGQGQGELGGALGGMFGGQAQSSGRRWRIADWSARVGRHSRRPDRRCREILGR